MGAAQMTCRHFCETAGVVWLALDAPQELTGKFLRDGNVIPW
jgi:hypothetical protein